MVGKENPDVASVGRQGLSGYGRGTKVDGGRGTQIGRQISGASSFTAGDPNPFPAATSCGGSTFAAILQGSRGNQGPVRNEAITQHGARRNVSCRGAGDHHQAVYRQGCWGPTACRSGIRPAEDLPEEAQTGVTRLGFPDLKGQAQRLIPGAAGIGLLKIGEKTTRPA